MSEASKISEIEAKPAKTEHEFDESHSTLSLFAKVGYGFGHVFNDLCGTLWFSYTLLFLKDVLHMPNEAGSYMMLGQIVDAVASAMFGVMTDRYSTKRNWHILGTVVVVVSFPALFVMQRDKMPYLGSIFYFSLFVTVFQSGWAIVQISHLAILPEMAATHADRSKLNSIRYIMTVFSNISVFVLAWLTLHVSGSTDHIGRKDFENFRKIAICLTVVGIITTIIFHVSLSMSKYSERRLRKMPSMNLSSPDVTPLVKMSSVLKNVKLYKIAFLYTFSRLFLVICVIYIPIWLNESMKSNHRIEADNIAIIPLIFFVASFFAAFILKYINQKISYMIIYLAGSLISISGCLWIQFTSSFVDINELIGIAILFGTGSSITQISSLCITADLMEDSTQWSGLIYSIITFCDKLFSGIIIIVISTLETIGNGKQYYANVLFYNGGTALLGVFVLATFKSKMKRENK